MHRKPSLGPEAIIDKEKHQELKNAQENEPSSPAGDVSSDAGACAQASSVDSAFGADVLLAEKAVAPKLVVDDDRTGSVETAGADEEKAFIIDFGISTVLQTARSATTDVTRTGEIFGTPQYMSPEQCVGDKPDERSDIYSFGCLMYETLAGRPPFLGVNPVQIIMQHLKNTPPEFEPSISKKKLAEQLELVTMKCLEKDRDKRLQNFSAVKAELDRLAAGTGESSIKVYSRASFGRRFWASLFDGFIICLIYHVFASGRLYTDYLSPLIVPTLFGGATTISAIVGSVTASAWWLDCTAWPAAWVVLHYLQCSHREPWVVLFPLIAVLYYCIFESSSFRATPGKMYMGIFVKPKNSEKVSPAIVFKRLLLKLIGFQTAVISGLVAAPTPKVSAATIVRGLVNEVATDQWSGAEVVSAKTPDSNATSSKPLWRSFCLVALGSLVAFLLLTPPLSYFCVAFLVLKLMYDDCSALTQKRRSPKQADETAGYAPLRAETMTMAQAYNHRRTALIWLIVLLAFTLITHFVMFSALLIVPLVIYLRKFHARFIELSGKASVSSAPSWTTLFMRSLRKTK